MEVLSAILGATSEGVLWGIMAIGVFITYSVLDFSDLTVDGSFALGGVSCAVFITKGMNPFLSLFLSILLGMVAGAVTGLLHTKLKIPGILSSILTMIALYSVNMRIASQQANIPFMKSPTIISIVQDLTGTSRVISTLIVGLIVAILVVGVLYWFFGTEVGSAIRATGNNEHMARALGVNTDSMKMIGLMVSNGLVAMSGGLVAQSDRVGNVGMGTGTIVIGLAAVVIGNVLVKSNENFALRMSATIIGSMVYRVIIATVLQLGLRTDDQKLFTAIIVAIALSYPNLKEKLKGKQKSKEVGKC